MLQTWRMTLDLLDRRERVRFFIVIGIMVLVTLAEVLSIATIVPLLMVLAEPELVETNRYLATAFEAGGFESVFAFQMALAVVVCLAVVAGLLIKTIGNYIIIRFVSMREYSIASRLMEAYLAHPYSWFLDKNTAQTARRLLSAVTEVITKIMIPLASLVGSLLLVLFLVVALLVADPLVALLAGGILSAAYILVYVKVQRRLADFGQRLLKAQKARFHIAQEAFGGLKEVKLMGLEADYLSRFREPVRTSAQVRAANQALSMLPRHLIEGVAFATMILMLILMVQRAGGSFTAAVPTIGLFAVASLRLLPALQATYYALTQIRSGQAVLADLHRDYMEARAALSVAPPPAAGRLDLARSLELRNLTFRYQPGSPAVVDDLTVEIRAGDTIGIVGGTGSGKTTLVDLILGLLPLESGGIIVDGVPITRDNVRAWQKSVGYVPQTIFLSDSSVAANIAFGLPDDRIDMAAVEAAARLASLHDFIMSDLPEAYQTTVGERGVRLSGGQRQRIGIARALYTDPSLLVLDEATSALDNLTEGAVMDAVHAIGRSKTIIMIAHRLSTVRDCDRIYLMEQGRVAQSGTFDELVESSELFRRMAART
jgi:ABC-type multidrug transport system fused ATPase/permease subunit